MSINPENKCSHLFDQLVKHLPDIEGMFDMQKNLQDHLAEKGKALNYDTATYKEKVNDITTQWRNMNLEMAELIERLPFKEWKTYSEDDLNGFKNREDMLETYYEYIDVFHFFMNVGLALGIDGETFRRLYATKNKENFDRQKRGY